MDELCSENDFNYFAINNDNQQCPEMNFAATFFLLLGMIPISVLFAMISISQHMRLTGDLIIEEEEEIEIPFSEKFPLKKNCDSNKEPNTELLSVLECTPNGNVFMKYDLENESFDYWSDYKEIPFSHLEAVARKYVNTFCCTDLYLREESEEDSEEESQEETSGDEETNSEYSSDFDEDDEQITKDSEDDNSSEKETSQEEKNDSDDEIFAKLKSAEKIKEVIQEEGVVVNKFRYKGKLMDILEFKQKKSKKNEPKNVSFSSWKMF